LSAGIVADLSASGGFKWNVKKNKILAKEKEVTFEEIVQKISSGGKVTEMEHP